MLSTQIWIVIKKSNNSELNEQSLGGNECEELTPPNNSHRLQKIHKKKPTIRLTTSVTMFWASQRSLLYMLLVLDEVKCKTHTLQSTSTSETA